MLENIHDPKDIKNLNIKELEQLSKEVREETVKAVSQTGGHLGAGLGVVELTVALHYVFDTPNDKIIWDVGHQAYPHKILTGRREKMSSLRQAGGLSGFTKRKESEYDPFGAGHSSTSISAALGMAAARDLNKQANNTNDNKTFETIAVIGDGAISAGMAYEAMNNAGAMQTRMIVILNDNKMSIAPAVGAMSGYLSRLISSKPYLTLRNIAKKVASHLPDSVEKAAKKAEQYTKDFWAGGNLFEEMGFYYVGPVNGHDLPQLVAILNNIKEDKSINRPILIHVATEKGHGYQMPEAKDNSLHAVGKFDIETGKLQKKRNSNQSYTEVFANQLIHQAKEDEKIVAITAAMPCGTGLDKFAKEFPERMFDVAIAEQHAVTFAAGMACEGYKPFCAIYSTFLQRAYDQIVHDVAIQSLPVRFAIDRAGLVGADGPTHAGSFDIMFTSSLPNFIVIAPSDEIELMRCINFCSQDIDKPIAFRYPRGEGLGLEIPKHEQIEAFELGKGRIIKQSKPDKKNDIAILSLGTRLEEAKKAASELEKLGHTVTVADARFVKPLDKELVESLAKNHKLLITIEEGSIGGFGSHILQHLTESGLDNKIKMHSMSLPDKFIEQNDVYQMYEEAKLNSSAIVEVAAQKMK